MTTIVPFLPSNLFAPQFGATFDGDNYNVIVTWNVSAQRYYVNIYGLDGTWIVTVPLVQTPPSRSVASVAYDNLRRVTTITLVDPSQWPIPLASSGLLTPPGTIVDYTLENFDPSVFNATWRSLQVSPTSFSFPLADNPGQVNILGFASRYMNMVNGIFETSTFIYRNGAFEISP